MGWLLGRRFLLLTYRGRKTGRSLLTVLEVVRHDPATHESVVISAYGPTAGWYLSIMSAPALRVQTGRLDYTPTQRFLTADEARVVAEAFCRDHPLEARLAPRVLSSIGAGERSGHIPGSRLLSSLPMVGFRPQ